MDMLGVAFNLSNALGAGLSSAQELLAADNCFSPGSSLNNSSFGTDTRHALSQEGIKPAVLPAHESHMNAHMQSARSDWH